MGIDVGGGPKPITFVVFDPSQQVQAIGEGDIVDALAYAAGQTGGALLAVNAAARPNQGRMRRSKVRAFLSPRRQKASITRCGRLNMNWNRRAWLFRTRQTPLKNACRGCSAALRWWKSSPAWVMRPSP
ncbi:MAG: hypothetical protein GX491_00970 [Chloroflexi bacterium]|nr:hypothetical protein [Chloroflexota bacterium]